MKILLIGNSFSYYWTDELYKLLAAGGDEDAVVCNIYYSGCAFDMHLNWWKEGANPYTVLIHDKNGRTAIKKTTFETGLNYAKWDKISFQQSGRYIYGSLEKHDKMIGDYLPELYERVRARFPEVKEYFWLQNWTHELGTVGHGHMKTRERQLMVYEGFRDIGKKYCKQFGFTNVPCGDAWELIRHEPMFYSPGEEGVLPNRTLHTRIGTGGFKDYPFVYNNDLSHDGDIGGGQYLNAAVWFEMLTHKSVVGNTYIPSYTHDTAGITFTFTEERVAALQNAAHQAVLNAYGEEWYK